jgi:hypothetical protein
VHAPTTLGSAVVCPLEMLLLVERRV